ncbi:hypothetical protein IEO21_07384 [Rhodonia placenta]|uniref:Uncharacterized protein n=1 Tax=Rhodonia placenta TaxID=104341 RepID=A0A8H7NY80_9APHY|nr:hypothetical protein IEO21_07384 [Postia placenta]
MPDKLVACDWPGQCMSSSKASHRRYVCVVSFAARLGSLAPRNIRACFDTMGRTRTQEWGTRLRRRRVPASHFRCGARGKRGCISRVRGCVSRVPGARSTRASRGPRTKWGTMIARTSCAPPTVLRGNDRREGPRGARPHS